MRSYIAGLFQNMRSFVCALSEECDHIGWGGGAGGPHTLGARWERHHYSVSSSTLIFSAALANSSLPSCLYSTGTPINFHVRSRITCNSAPAEGWWAFTVVGCD